MQRLSREREREEARAKEVREGREAGDTKVDEICNWCVSPECTNQSCLDNIDCLADARLTSSIAFYKTLMGIKTVRAVSENVLHIEYDVSNSMSTRQSKRGQQPPVNQSVILSLSYDPVSKRLAEAEVSEPGRRNSL